MQCSASLCLLPGLSLVWSHQDGLEQSSSSRSGAVFQCLLRNSLRACLNLNTQSVSQSVTQTLVVVQTITTGRMIILLEISSSLLAWSSVDSLASQMYWEPPMKICFGAPVCVCVCVSVCEQYRLLACLPVAQQKRSDPKVNRESLAAACFQLGNMNAYMHAFILLLLLCSSHSSLKSLWTATEVATFESVSTFSEAHNLHLLCVSSYLAAVFLSFCRRRRRGKVLAILRSWEPWWIRWWWERRRRWW